MTEIIERENTFFRATKDFSVRERGVLPYVRVQNSAVDADRELDPTSFTLEWAHSGKSGDQWTFVRAVVRGKLIRLDNGQPGVTDVRSRFYRLGDLPGWLEEQHRVNRPAMK